ncbi:hypothetical protein CSE45_2881 [Citreicella sp. SE45]|nr:hypothetical protein CSE45_2881 [Citreicella sp. SE45]
MQWKYLYWSSRIVVEHLFIDYQKFTRRGMNRWRLETIGPKMTQGHLV